MKKLILFLSAVIITAGILAQPPQGISHQAVMRDAENNLIIESLIGLKVSILQGTHDGEAVYVETHQVMTNANGLITYIIGEGDVVQGLFEDVDWSDGPYFLKTEADPEGGMDYSITGITQFHSVPYAMHSKTAEEAKTLKDGIHTGEIIYWDGDHWVPITPGEHNQTLRLCDGVPTWGPCLYDLVLFADPLDGGTVTGDGEYEEGTEVSITAIPNEGWEFVEWIGDTEDLVNTEDNPASLTMPADNLEIAASFIMGGYTLTLNSSPELTATVWPSPFQEYYDAGDEIVITVYPESGWEFSHWSGDTEGLSSTTEHPATLTMPANDVEIIAHTQQKEYTLILNADPESGGTVIGAGDNYTSGQEVSIEAIANPEYEFVNWTGSVQFLADENAAETTLTMPTHDIELTANFQHEDDSEINYGDGVTDIEGNEYVTVIIGDQEWMAENLRVTRYNNEDDIPTGLNDEDWGETTKGAYAIYNNDVDMQEAYGNLYNWHAADDERGLCPEGWSVPNHADWLQLLNYLDLQGFPNQVDYQNAAGNALKSCRQENSPQGGDCDTSEHPRWSSDDTYYGFDEFGFSALPGGQRFSLGNFGLGDDGYWWSATEEDDFEAWCWMMFNSQSYVTYLAQSKSDGVSVRCIRDEAEEPTTYSLNLEVNPPGSGTVTGEGQYEPDEEILISTSPSEGYLFIDWTDEFGVIFSSAMSFNYVMPQSDITFIANYELKNYSISLTANPIEGGMVEGDGVYNMGDEATISAIPNEGWEFVEWTGDTDGLTNTEDNPASLTMPANNVEIVASFQPINYNITINHAFGAGSVEIDPVGGPYYFGDVVDIEAIPNPGYEFVNWTGDVEGLADENAAATTLTMPADDVELTANFQEEEDSDIVYGDGVTDIDGNEYVTVIIGEQEWMAENLRVTRYNNEDDIPTGLNDEDWENTTEGAYAITDHNVPGADEINSPEEMVAAYGKLYNWYAVDDPRGLCPSGWRVASMDDWNQLLDYVVSEGFPHDFYNPNGAGNALRSCRQIDSPLGGDCDTSEHPRWSPHGTHHGFDEFGFSALPGGRRGSDGFYSIGPLAYWWTATELSATMANGWRQFWNHGSMNSTNTDKLVGHSVRCVREVED